MQVFPLAHLFASTLLKFLCFWFQTQDPKPVADGMPDELCEEDLRTEIFLDPQCLSFVVDVGSFGMGFYRFCAEGHGASMEQCPKYQYKEKHAHEYKHHNQLRLFENKSFTLGPMLENSDLSLRKGTATHHVAL